MPTQFINNLTFHYQERGQGLPVVLVHGFPLDSRIWNHQIEGLSDRYRVIAPDLRGFGKSASIEPFTVRSLAEDLHELLKCIGALPCVLGGLSMGGYVALAFAKEYASLKGLILIDTRAEADPPAGKENRARMIQLVREKGAKSVADEMFPKMVSDQTVRDRPQVAQNLRQIMESQSPVTIENALAAMRDREDHSGDLPEILAPSLILVGQDDAITPPAFSQAMHKSMANSTLTVFPGAGHMSPMEQPAEVTAEIRSFLVTLTR